MFDIIKEILTSEKEFTETNYKELIEDKLYQIKDQFIERKITTTKFYSILLKKIHSVYDGNSIICKIQFANKEIITQNI